MPRPKSLTPEGIAAAALGVIEQDGLDALSMRSVAASLGVGTMSLYRYVDGRDEIEILVVASVLDRVDTRVPPDSPWQQRIRQLMTNVRAVVTEHPAILPLLLIHRQHCAGTLRCGEALLGALADGGLTGREQAVALRTLLSYLFGSLQVESLSPLSGAGTAALAELPVEHYPRLAETASVARAIPADEEFRRGLEIILCGLGRSRTA